jgi:hypothetical protein
MNIDPDEPSSSDAACASDLEDETPDAFENELHTDVFNYLTFRIIPLSMRGPGKALFQKRKTWTQNARRRYTVKKSIATGEDELYHVRGQDMCKKQEASQNISSKIRSKFYKIRRVLKEKESLAIVRLDHSLHHDGHNVAEPRLNQDYMIHDLREKIKAVDGNRCPTCASHEPVKKNPIVPILTTRRGQLVMFDLTKYYVSDEEGYVWILTVLDHFTKYLWAKGFKNKDAGPIAEWLYEHFSGNITMPERWHADNGGEFKNYHIDAVRQMLSLNCDEKTCCCHILTQCQETHNVKDSSNEEIRQSNTRCTNL